MTAKLIAEEGTLEGLVLSFDSGEEWTIGRDPDTCELLVEDPEVSREHLVAHKAPDGTISIENLSKNKPALVNDQALKGSQKLQHGDMVQIGGGVFRFYTEIGGQQMGPNDSKKITTPSGQDEVEEELPNDDEEEGEDTIFGSEDADDDDLLADIDFNLSETGRWMLKVIAGPNNGAEFSMEPGQSYTLGTSPEECAIVFHDVSVSRQHAKISISKKNEVTIQDLKSRNGVSIDDQKVKGSAKIPSNAVVALGTTSFIVFDREGDRQTIITPLLPSIVKNLKGDNAANKPSVTKEKSKESSDKKNETAPQPAPTKSKSGVGRFIAMVLLAGMLALVAMGTTSLFRSKEVTLPTIDTEAELERVMIAYPKVRYNFNEGSGKLLLIGNVQKGVDKAQMTYALQGLSFIREIDDRNLVIDEGVVQQMNKILAKRPEWRGVNLTSPSAGRYILQGYLETKKQSEALSDYMAQNFGYLDLLEKRVVVEENETSAMNSLLAERGFNDVIVQMTAGELTLSGTIRAGRSGELETLIGQFKRNAAVRTVKNFVIELAKEASIVNLTDSYTVTGSSNRGGVVVNIVINGKILGRGDLLDGMTVTELKRDVIFLERDDVKYKIEYNK